MVDESSDSDVENDEEGLQICDDTSELSMEDPNVETVFEPSILDLDIDDHVVVRFSSNHKSARYFIGRIRKVNKRHLMSSL
jgi:hypothetical protein